MKKIRVIPILLLHNQGLVKSVKFRNYKYVGDPINAVRIFNEKEVDELSIIDIDATRGRKSPDIAKITSIVSEAFMPVSYGGGITSLNEVEGILKGGVEKVIVNKVAVSNPKLITEIAQRFGSQSIVVSIDFKKTLFGYNKVYAENGKNDTGLDPVLLAKRVEDAGAGEILLNSIDRDGTYSGFDLKTISKVAEAVDIPVVAVGGAASVEDFKAAVEHGASAVGAGSMFVFKRPHQAVLISYLSEAEFRNLFN